MNVNNKRSSDIPLQELDQQETKKEKVEPFPILKLPDEIILQIFLSTDTNARLPLVCKRFQSICKEQSYLIFTKAFDRFLPNIHRKLTSVATDFCRTDYDYHKEGLNWEVFNTIFNNVFTDNEKEWMKYGSYYDEMGFHGLPNFEKIPDYQIEKEANSFERFFESVRRKYMEVAENVIEARLYLPLTDSLEKIKRRLTILKVTDFPPADGRKEAYLCAKKNIAFISECQNLKHLRLHDLILHSDKCENIGTIFRNIRLERLTISYSEFEPICPKFFEKAAQSTSLEEIILSQAIPTIEAAEQIASMSSLKKFTFEFHCLLNNAAIQKLACSSTKYNDKAGNA